MLRQIYLVKLIPSCSSEVHLPQILYLNISLNILEKVYSYLKGLTYILLIFTGPAKSNEAISTANCAAAQRWPELGS